MNFLKRTTSPLESYKNSLSHGSSIMGSIKSMHAYRIYLVVVIKQ